MEHGTLQREVQTRTWPEVVHQVISRPEHLRQWWPDEADIEPVPGATGLISFGDREAPDLEVVSIAVVEAHPSRRFAFRWSATERLRCW